MAEENISQKFKLKNIDQTRIDLIEKINWNELMSKNHKKTCTTLNYIEQFLISGFAITECVSITDFVSLVSILRGIASSAIVLKICVITAVIEKCKLIIKKKKHDKIVLLAKSNLNSVPVLVSKDLIDSVISQKNIAKGNKKSKIERFS